MKRLALLALLCCSFATPTLAQTVQRVSTPEVSVPPPAGGGGDSWASIISQDGRYVLFASAANNLVISSNSMPIPYRFPARLNVFLRDRTNATTTLVSVNTSGVAGGNGDSVPVDISTNGRYALFQSSASDLVPGDTNNASDVFIRDLVMGVTLLISANTNGVVGNGVSRSPAMTPDGRYVAFVSAANDLVPGDTNQIPDVFVRDMQASTTILASVGARSTSSAVPTGSSESPDITPDGHFVAFYSTATNIVPRVPAAGDIYVRDLVGATTVWASTGARAAALAALGKTNVVCFNHAISADGQSVAYETSLSSATLGLILRYNLGSGMTEVIHTNAAVNGPIYEDIRTLDMTPDGGYIAFLANTNDTSGETTCVYLWDEQAQTLTLASGDLTGAVAPSSACDWPTLSPSGRFVAFLSDGVNLVTNGLLGDYHMYVRDMQAGLTTLVDSDINDSGSPIGIAGPPSISADGSLIAFRARYGRRCD